MVFKSAVDTWFQLLACGLPFFLLAVGIPALRRATPAGAVAVVASLVFAAAILLWLLHSTRYEVTADELLVRSGPFRWTIPLHEIHGVRASDSLLSSPALSTDRLEIRYGRNSAVLVSPADRDGFLKAIGHSLPE